MARNKEHAPGWGACKYALRSMTDDQLVRLVQNLYSMSEENRVFLHARLLPEQSEDALRQAVDKLKKMVSYSSVLNNRFRHRDVKRFIDQFAKASGDNAAVAELLLVDLSESLSAFDELGDVPQLVDHSMSVMDRLDKVLRQLPRDRRPPLVERLNELARTYGRSFGYGLSDELVGLASEWKERMGEGPMEAV